MPDEIRPALTPEEWELGRGCFRSGRQEGLGLEYVFALLSQHFDGPALVALFNDALPDGHENKITREDLEAVDTGGLREPYVDYAGLARFRAKLAALLPPDAPR